MVFLTQNIFINWVIEYNFVFFLVVFLGVNWWIVYRFKNEPLSISSIVKDFDFFGFIIANGSLFLIFKHFLSPSQWWAFYIFFIISFIILCQDKIVKIFRKNIPQNIQNEGFNSERDRQKNREYLKKIMPFFFSTFIKEIFFNTIYYLFPLILIWLSLAGLFFLINLVTYSPTTYFFEIITVISIILGIFQFYLERLETKVLVKITQYSQLIERIIENETNFEHFYKYIEGDSNFSGWINRTIEPKLYANDILVKILTDAKKNKMPLITDLIKRYQGSLVNITLNTMDSNQKFSEIENKAEKERFFNGESFDQLLVYYTFFFGETADTAIINEIEKKLDIKKFGNLIFSNINLFQEASAEFINIELQDLANIIYEDENSKSPQFSSLEILFEPKNGSKITLIPSMKLREIMKSRIMTKLRRKILED